MQGLHSAASKLETFYLNDSPQHYADADKDKQLAAQYRATENFQDKSLFFEHSSYHKKELGDESKQKPKICDHSDFKTPIVPTIWIFTRAHGHRFWH
jgi:hypothetical protein